jgi:hypothetical protein
MFRYAGGAETSSRSFPPGAGQIWRRARVVSATIRAFGSIIYRASIRSCPILGQ